MTWVAVAIGGGALIGAVGSNLAAGTQAGGQQQAAQTQLSMFNTINQQQQPFIQGGYGALNQLMYGLGIGGTAPNTGAPTMKTGSPTGTAQVGGLPPARTGISARPGQPLPNLPGGLAGPAVPGGAGGGGMTPGQLTSNFTPQDFLNNVDPGYGFQLATGGQAIRNQDTPSVGALSGPALKDLMSFNQSMAATGYQNAYNRFQTTNQNIFSRLSGIAGLGQNAASNVGTSGTQLGTGIAGAQAGAAASQAGGIVGATNAIGGSSIPLAYLMAGQQQSGGAGTGGAISFDPNSWNPSTPNPTVGWGG